MIRILHLSDPHFGAADPAIAARFLAQAAELAPDLTVLSGDLTMRARRRELIEARNFVERLPRPRLVIPGNHDIPALNQPFHRLFAPFKRYREVFGQELEPVHTAPGLHVVGMNSNKAFNPKLDWSLGHLSAENLRRADQRLSGAPGSFRVLVLHHPLIAPEGHKRDVVQPLAELQELIARHRVDLVLCGHFHCSHMAAIGPQGAWHCVVSQAATVCSTRLQGEPQGFHMIQVEGGLIEIERFVYGGENFELEKTFTFTRVEEGWESADTATRREEAKIA
ncbi:metallophosphoesterase [Haloferula sp. BvORR071]|uniref:metallophosphoesterase family protein n=1 Tax=Haloferula sp. BvORR071 TaxID=1396141 RepID=UPI0006982BF0|nr:metallophosphoesterase [Haloferula sp. BvORR071]